ncbi:hypothetical protein B0O80DRAFT_487565 [Mortierella sp. GBAus27b]|nr:hypothetical protein B0O80DRAFT_487565 [Mortierella sp. GBAus27b]
MDAPLTPAPSSAASSSAASSPTTLSSTTPSSTAPLSTTPSPTAPLSTAPPSTASPRLLPPPSFKTSSSPLDWVYGPVFQGTTLDPLPQQVHHCLPLPLNSSVLAPRLDSDAGYTLTIPDTHRPST